MNTLENLENPLSNKLINFYNKVKTQIYSSLQNKVVQIKAHGLILKNY